MGYIMNTIECNYVKFEQAKILKEKSFDIFCDSFFNNKGKIKNGDYHWWSWRQRVKKKDDIFFLRPEHWKVVEWLRINHNIWIEVKRVFDSGKYIDEYFINFEQELGIVSKMEKLNFKTPQEAYSAAFDYLLPKLK